MLWGYCAIPFNKSWNTEYVIYEYDSLFPWVISSQRSLGIPGMIGCDNRTSKGKKLTAENAKG